MKFNYGFISDIGRRRSQNQDRGGALLQQGLFVVADGMGGHSGGEIASSMAVEVIVKTVAELPVKLRDQPREAINRAIIEANHRIYERSNNEPMLQGMGTTTTSLLFTGNELTIGHVGDSRCYFIRRGAIWQLTRDHSLVQEKIRAGIITREEAKHDRMRNVITRSVGFEPVVDVEIYEMETHPGDLFLICSDGLTGHLEDFDILELIDHHTHPDSPASEDDSTLNRVAQALVDTANERGGEDNITVSLIRVL